MPQAADHDRTERVVGNRSSLGPCHHWHRDPGEVRQRPRTGVRRSVRPGVLEAQAWEVGPLQEHQRKGGQNKFSIIFR